MGSEMCIRDRSISIFKVPRKNRSPIYGVYSLEYSDAVKKLFDKFGYPLEERHRISRSVLDSTSEQLRVSIPLSLLQFYETAGAMDRFCQPCQRFLHPSNWFENDGHLAFIAENQGACWWGVALESEGPDPVVCQGLERQGGIEWIEEEVHCFQFISTMLHYQAVNGGFDHSGSTEAPPNARERLLRENWEYAGEINGMFAYARSNQVACLIEGTGLPFMPNATVFAGAKTSKDLSLIGESLGINF